MPYVVQREYLITWHHKPTRFGQNKKWRKNHTLLLNFLSFGIDWMFIAALVCFVWSYEFEIPCTTLYESYEMGWTVYELCLGNIGRHELINEKQILLIMMGNRTISHSKKSQTHAHPFFSDKTLWLVFSLRSCRVEIWWFYLIHSYKPVYFIRNLKVMKCKHNQRHQFKAT